VFVHRDDFSGRAGYQLVSRPPTEICLASPPERRPWRAHKSVRLESLGREDGLPHDPSRNTQGSLNGCCDPSRSTRRSRTSCSLWRVRFTPCDGSGTIPRHCPFAIRDVPVGRTRPCAYRSHRRYRRGAPGVFTGPSERQRLPNARRTGPQPGSGSPHRTVSRTRSESPRAQLRRRRRQRLDFAVPRIGRFPKSSESLRFIPVRLAGLLSVELSAECARNVNEARATFSSRAVPLRIHRNGCLSGWTPSHSLRCLR
jgi:hypothetical protein